MDRRAPQSPPTADRLRADISRGRTGEKVDFPDPAAAPFGTDDEAAGRAPSVQERQMEAASRPALRAPPAPSRTPLILYVGLILLLAAGLLTAAWAFL